MRLAQSIANAKAMRDYTEAAYLPPHLVSSDDELKDYVREYSATIFHPVGTCKMGEDPRAVVDSRLRVRGIQGLRVMDASVMPTIASSNTNAPAMMIGERAAELMLADARVQ